MAKTDLCVYNTEKFCVSFFNQAASVFNLGGGGSSKKVFLGLPSVHEQENLLNLIQYNYWLAFNHRIGLSQIISKIIDKVEFGNDRYLKCIKFDPINT